MSKIIAIEVRPVRFGEPAFGEDDIITAKPEYAAEWAIYQLRRDFEGYTEYDWLHSTPNERDAWSYAKYIARDLGVPARDYTGI